MITQEWVKGMYLYILTLFISIYLWLQNILRNFVAT